MKNAKAKHTLDLTILLRKFRKVTGALSAFKPEAVDKRSKTDKCEIVRVKFMCKARGYKPRVKETVEAERWSFRKSVLFGKSDFIGIVYYLVVASICIAVCIIESVSALLFWSARIIPRQIKVHTSSLAPSFLSKTISLNERRETETNEPRAVKDEEPH